MFIVYSYYVMDILHKGHLELLKNAKKIAGPGGILFVGILTDEAVMEKKLKPMLSFDERIELARSIAVVDVVVAQDTYSPLPNVMRIEPDILLESSSHSKESILAAKECMDKIGGRLIVIPYYPKHSSTELKEQMKRM